MVDWPAFKNLGEKCLAEGIFGWKVLELVFEVAVEFVKDASLEVLGSIWAEIEIADSSPSTILSRILRNPNLSTEDCYRLQNKRNLGPYLQIIFSKENVLRLE